MVRLQQTKNAFLGKGVSAAWINLTNARRLCNSFRKETAMTAADKPLTPQTGLQTRRQDAGGRGITVCERWKSFINFFEDMGMPGAGQSLDRINNDGNYEPSNCKWSTRKEQMVNSSRSKPITMDGKTDSISGWAKTLGVSKGKLWYRVSICGMNLKDAIVYINGEN